MHRLVYTRQFLDRFGALPGTLRDAVERTIDRLAVDAEIGKPLLGRLAGFRAIRIGNYRLLYTIEGSGTRRQIVLRSFRHRALVYRGRHRRLPTAAAERHALGRPAVEGAALR